MKKIKLLLCTFMLCTLTACGKSEHEHQALLDMIENNQYQEAIQYVNDLAYEYHKENTQTVQKDSLTELLLGEWVYVESSHYQFSDFKTMEFKDDYTVLCDGKEYLWEVTYEDTSNELDYIEVKILDGASEYLRFTFNREDYKINLGQYVDGSYQWNSVNFFHISEYEKVEITVDNFFDYFEIYEYVNWSKNSFDEVTSMSVSRAFTLKDEYYSRVPRIYNEVAIEYKYKTSNRNITVDWNNQTYSFGDITKTNDYEYDHTTEMYHTTYNEVEKYGIGFNSIHYSIDSSNDYITGYINDFEFTRIKGAIYLKK